MSGRPPCDRGILRAGRCASPAPRNDSAWILAATILASSMTFIDATVVNIALPVIETELHASIIAAEWIVVGYSLFLSALLLVGGSLGDHYGRKRIFVIGVLIFAIASVACGAARNVNELVAARAVQGIGSALLTPGSLAIIGASFDHRTRGKAIGTWSSFTAVTSAMAPALGGWIVQHASWRWIFYINVPLAVAVLVITWFRVPESRDPEDVGGLDWWGAGLGTLGLGGITFGLIFSSVLGWINPFVLCALAGGAGALVAFVFAEARGKAPMVPLDLFKSRIFSGVNLLTFLLYCALGGLLFLLPFNLIQVQGYSPTAAGLSLLPFVALMFSLGRWAGGLADKYGPGLPLTIGAAITAIGFALFALPGVGGSYWTTFFPAIAVMGLGLALAVAPLTTAVMTSVTDARVGLASAVNNAVARVAGLVAVAAFNLIAIAVFSTSLGRALATLHAPHHVIDALWSGRLQMAALRPPPGTSASLAGEARAMVAASYVSAFRATAVVAAAMALASAVIAGLTFGRLPKRDPISFLERSALADRRL